MDNGNQLGMGGMQIEETWVLNLYFVTSISSSITIDTPQPV